jgi:hypothetical protein
VECLGKQITDLELESTEHFVAMYRIVGSVDAGYAICGYFCSIGNPSFSCPQLSLSMAFLQPRLSLLLSSVQLLRRSVTPTRKLEGLPAPRLVRGRARIIRDVEAMALDV